MCNFHDGNHPTCVQKVPTGNGDWYKFIDFAKCPDRNQNIKQFSLQILRMILLADGKIHVREPSVLEQISTAKDIW